MENIQDVKERYGEEAEAAARRAQDEIQKAAERLRAKSQQIWEDAADFIRDNPGTAVGIAVAGGVVLGALMSRGSNTSLRDQAAELADKTLTPKSKENIAATLTQLRDLLNQTITKLQ
jgi:hypothetical protein